MQPTPEQCELQNGIGAQTTFLMKIPYKYIPIRLEQQGYTTDYKLSDLKPWKPAPNLNHFGPQEAFGCLYTV